MKNEIVIFVTPDTYPCLKQSVLHPDLIILFSTPNHGIVVQEGGSLKKGYFGTWFNPEKYKLVAADGYILQTRINGEAF